MSGTPGGHRPHHAAKFYENEASLYRTVSQFLIEGLRSGEPAINIATPAHAAGIHQLLEEGGVNVAAAIRRGDLVVLDAEETLGTFMVGHQPHGDLFGQQVGGIIEQVLRGRASTRLRAYGEMVDVLWKQGNTRAAIELEMLWNQLARRYDFALLCGYAMGNFYKEAVGFDDVCRQHSHVLDPATDAPSFDPHHTRYS